MFAKSVFVVLILNFFLFEKSQAQLSIKGKWQVKSVEMYNNSTQKILKKSTDKALDEFAKELKNMFLNQIWEFQVTRLEFGDGISRDADTVKLSLGNNKFIKGEYSLFVQSDWGFWAVAEDDDSPRMPQNMNCKVMLGAKSNQRYFFTHTEIAEGGKISQATNCIRITLEEVL